MLRIKIALVSLLVLFGGQSAFALTDADIKQLRSINDTLESFDALEGDDRNIERIAAVESTKRLLLLEAGDIFGEPVTQDQLKEITVTFGEKVAGVITFGNILWVTGGIFIFIALFFLGGHYAIGILAQIPAWLYEALIYTACFGAIVGGNFLSLTYQVPTAFIGCIGLVGAAFFTYWLHFGGSAIRKHYDIATRFRGADSETFSETRKWWAERFPNIANWVVTVIWGLAAVYYESQLLGFISVWGLLSALGFMAGMAPFCVFIGFAKDAYVARTMIVSGLLLLFYVLAELVLGITGNPVYTTFVPGISFMGTFVYFLCVLIVSSKYYSGKGAYRDDGKRSSGDNFIPLQFLAILSGIAVLYLGSVYGMGAMLGVGGTFFYIYLAEKYFEIPWKGIGWAWAVLLFGVVCYLAGTWALQHPQYFLLGS